MTENNSNQKQINMMTTIWGPPQWTAMHTMAYSFPETPTIEQKQYFFTYFSVLAHVLPCENCRESYSNIIKKADTILNMDTMFSHSTLNEWLYKVHNSVNAELGVNYNISLEDMIYRYSKYKAECNGEEKKCNKEITYNAYSLSLIKDCPIISSQICEQFIPYAKHRGCNNSDFVFINDIKKDQRYIYNCLDAKYDSKIWIERNKECDQLIIEMKSNNIPSLEFQGRYIGLPTLLECKLILRLSSNLSEEILVEVLASKKLKKLDVSITQEAQKPNYPGGLEDPDSESVESIDSVDSEVSVEN